MQMRLLRATKASAEGNAEENTCALHGDGAKAKRRSA